MRITILATGAFAVPSIEWLVSSSHDLLAVISRPAKARRSRSKTVDSPSVTAAHAAGVRIETPPTVNDAQFHHQLAQRGPDLFFVCDYGEILSAETLAIPRLGGINLHGSLLPAYRGAAPVAWAILDGCTETGVSVIHMTPRLDAGPILSQARLSIDSDEDAAALEHRLARLGVATVQEGIAMLESWDGQSPIGREQDPAKASKAPRLHREQGSLDWNRSAQQLANQVRGLQPWPSAYTYCRSGSGDPLRLQVIRARPVETEMPLANATPGSIWKNDNGDLLVATGDGALQLEVVRPENRKTMSGLEFLHGYRLQAGEQLGTAGPSSG